MYTILSLDGGGTRGLASLAILNELERNVRRSIADISGKPVDPNFRIVDCVELVAGTSTGAIIAAALCNPTKRLTVDNVVDLYRQHGKAIFARSWYHKLVSGFGLFSSVYDNTQLVQTVHSVVGDAKISQAEPPVLIPAYDLIQEAPHAFTTKEAKENEDEDYFLVDLVHAATAVPVFFTPAPIRSCNGDSSSVYIDAGLSLNNPSILALGSVLEDRKITQASCPTVPLNKIRLISIGTGKRAAKTGYEWMIDKLPCGTGALVAGVVMLMLIFFSQEGAADEELHRLTSSSEQVSSYYRLQPLLDGKAAAYTSYLDPSMMETLYNAGLQYTQANREFDELVYELATEYVGKHEKEVEP